MNERFKVNVCFLRSPKGLSKTIHLLSSALPTLADGRDRVANNVCKLLEAWHAKDLDERDVVAPAVVGYLLGRTLDKELAAKADIKRVWALRNELLGFNFQVSEASWKLQNFKVRDDAVIRPHYADFEIL